MPKKKRKRQKEKVFPQKLRIIISATFGGELVHQLH